MLNHLINTLNSREYGLFELFIFIRAGASTVASIAITLLVQNKICINRYNQTRHFCEHINNLQSVADQTSKQIILKDYIFADSTLFGNYKYYNVCVVNYYLILFRFLDIS